MKKAFFLFIALFLTAVLLDAQQPWQKISNPGTKEIAANFKTPPPEYGMILWWGWDGPMTDTVIIRDLDRIKAMGFRGVMIEAGYGMTAKYLSPEWFAMVKVAIGEAKRMKADYWDVWSDLFRDNFFNIQAAWCKENNIGDLTWATHEESGNVTPKVIEALPAPDLTIDKILPQLKYLHRSLKDADLFFIFNESEEPQSFNITLQGKGKSKVWNAFTGKITTLKGTALSLDPWETKFIMKRK